MSSGFSLVEEIEAEEAYKAEKQAFFDLFTVVSHEDSKPKARKLAWAEILDYLKPQIQITYSKGGRASVKLYDGTSEQLNALLGNPNVPSEIKKSILSDALLCVDLETIPVTGVIIRAVINSAVEQHLVWPKISVNSSLTTAQITLLAKSIPTSERNFVSVGKFFEGIAVHPNISLRLLKLIARSKCGDRNETSSRTALGNPRLNAGFLFDAWNERMNDYPTPISYMHREGFVSNPNTPQYVIDSIGFFLHKQFIRSLCKAASQNKESARKILNSRWFTTYEELLYIAKFLVNPRNVFSLEELYLIYKPKMDVTQRELLRKYLLQLNLTDCGPLGRRYGGKLPEVLNKCSGMDFDYTSVPTSYLPIVME